MNRTKFLAQHKKRRTEIYMFWQQCDDIRLTAMKFDLSTQRIYDIIKKEEEE